ncbi:restriction endonuclease subunit S [Pseudarthrobacter sp. NPDC092439]|uniref:restriction endonuclease subunit S n=1 Tax=unclassified Pseudarthrobacter TaxID=2647000 RepID=UPI0038057C1A
MTWFGSTELPVTTFKQMFEVTLGKMLQPEAVNATDEMSPYLNSAAVRDGYVDDSNLKLMWTSYRDRVQLSLKANDLVVCEGGDVGRCALIKADTPVIFQNSVHRVRPRQGNDIRFAKYVLDALRSSGYLDVLCNKATIRHFTADKLANLPIPSANRTYQSGACDFLDRETAQIDDLIGKQERLIELLAEKRQAITSNYVAKSVEPTVDEPGVRLKHLYDVVDERANGASLPLMSVSIHRGLQRRDETTDDEPRADDLSNYKICRPGDVVINRMRAFQGALGHSSQYGLISPDYLVLRPHADVEASWLSAMLRSHWAIGQMRSRLRGIGSIDQGIIRTPRINASDLGEIRIRKPEFSAQRAFLRESHDAIFRLDLLTRNAASAISLLRERRAALISAAVTGKIYVEKGSGTWQEGDAREANPITARQSTHR